MPELVFKGKEFVYNHHLTVPVRPLVPHPGRSIGTGGLDGNLVIQGDNLHALKALLPFYAGRVNCVFIDPPYNTGNEGWSYNDNVNAPMLQAWLAANPVGIEDGLRHDKWPAMMLPRVKLLRELMSDSGSFLMTLDDNEMHRARVLLDEVFGPDNFVAVCVWHKNYAPKPSTQFFSEDHDYVLVYTRDKALWRPNLLARTDAMEARYTNPDNDPRGPWKSGDLSARNPYSEGIYPIICLGGRVIAGPPDGRYWVTSEAKFKALDRDKRVWWGEDGNNVPAIKRFLSEVQRGRVPQTLWEYDEVGHTQEAKQTLIEVMGGHDRDVFVTPKPVRLIERVLDLACDETSTILDAFAGSGTTGHAVLRANARDGGARRFVLVESEDYADTLTAERLRRVINGYPFKGTQRTELLREAVTWTTLRKAAELVERVASVEALEGAAYDSVDKSVKAGVLTVTGVKRIEEQAPGLGGAFTFCTLGAAVDLGALLAGDDLPSFAMLGAGLFHAATHAPFDSAAAQPPPDTTEPDADGLGYLGETAALHVWMLYRPDKAWLTSQAAALTQARAKGVAERKPPGKRHLVFAATRFVPQRVLDDAKIPVEFAPLPFGRERPADPPVAAAATTAPPPAAAP